MSIKAEATVEDLYKVDGKAELVNGEIVQMSPTGGLPNFAAIEITLSLRKYASRTKQGHAVGENAAFIVDLPNRKSFSPDAAFYRGDLTLKFFQGAPIFAAEVRSESDYGPRAEKSLADKRADYFAAGTLVVWDVDLMGDAVVKVYRVSEPEQPTIYRRGESAETEPALPRWKMLVDDLFPS